MAALAETMQDDAPELPPFSIDDIRRAVGNQSFARGQQYRAQGRVESVEPGDGGTIDAYVRGSRLAPYAVSIHLRPQRRGVTAVNGSCSCHVGYNCKHVAAALLELHASGTLARVTESKPGATPGEQPLPPEVASWLRRVTAATEVESDDYPPTVRRRLLYVIRIPELSQRVIISPVSIELDRNGQPMEAVRQHHEYVTPAAPANMPKFVRPSDRTLLRHIARLEEEEADVPAVLRSIIAMGRGRWNAWDGPVLTETAPVRAEIAWTLQRNGEQRPSLSLPEPLLALLFPEPWYVDPTTGGIGPVETGLPSRLVRTLLAGPALAPAIAARVRDELERRTPGHRLPAPVNLGAPRRMKETLAPVLQLRLGQLPFDVTKPYYGYYPNIGETYPTPVARLCWRYGPVTLGPDDTRHLLAHEGRLIHVVRDRPGETAAAARLSRLRFVPLQQRLPYRHPNTHDHMMLGAGQEGWIRFMLDDVPGLEADGWVVDVGRDFPIRIAPAAPVSFEMREGSGIDWFELDLGVMIDGVRVNLVPALLDLIQSWGSKHKQAAGQAALLVPLPDGRVLPVPFAQVEPILGPLLDLFAGTDPSSDTLRLTRRDAASIAALEAAAAAAGIAWSGGDAVRALGQQLRDHGGLPPCRVPDGFEAALRPYQQQGTAWLQFLRAAGLGGVLADDMGLGKTVQALAHLAIEQAEGRLDRPALVVCPTSLVGNWQSEAYRFAPMLRTLVLHGPTRAQQFDAINSHDVVITTYPLLARDHATLTEQEWHVVLLDEAQTIKNPLAATSKLARTLNARQRLCLSGTPLENHLGELWSLYDFLMPGFLGDLRSFGRRFRTPIEKNGDMERQAQLSRRVAPFLLRRTKQAVASDLPPKTEIAETVELGRPQQALYESIRLAMHAKVRAAIEERGLARSGIIVLDALLKLRQACCDPRLVKLSRAKANAGSAKLERLMELLPQMLEDGRRVLLFSQFTSMLALVRAELDVLRLPYVVLTGQTRDRATPVSQFQSGKVPLFLISLKAGGTGLNLTAADTVIHYDPWWNPAVEEQATDRAYRIGQDKPVFVHRLITSGTIEEKMDVLKRRKQALADGILGATGESSLALTETDLDVLFAPIDR